MSTALHKKIESTRVFDMGRVVCVVITKYPEPFRHICGKMQFDVCASSVPSTAYDSGRDKIVRNA